jgi:hypothetical protein
LARDGSGGCGAIAALRWQADGHLGTISRMILGSKTSNAVLIALLIAVCVLNGSARASMSDLHNKVDSQKTILNRKVSTPVWKLNQELLAKGKEKGIGIDFQTAPAEQMNPGDDGFTQYASPKAMLIKIRIGLSDSLFEPVISEEMEHALQNLDGFPKLRARLQQNQPLAALVSTTLLDIDAHQKMRRRGISTKPLGLDWFDQVKKNNLSRSFPPGQLEPVTGVAALKNPLYYAAWFYAFNDDPEMEPEAWSSVEKWFDQLPNTKALGKKCVEIIQKYGFNSIEARRQMYREILRLFNVADLFELYEGPGQSPTYTELL